MGGSNFGASGGPVWDAPADAPRARPEANFGTLCGRDTGVLAEPARGTFFGHVACHAQGGAHLACLSGSFYLCRSYAYNDNFWTDFHHFCNAQREPRATMCNAPGGLENESEKWTYFWVRKMVQEIPWRGQEVLFLDMYGYQWIYPEGIHGSPWIEIAMGYPWVGARARAGALARACLSF